MNRPKAKQFQGSKAAARRIDKEIRAAGLRAEAERQKIITSPDSSPEEVAQAMGIKLR